MKISKILKFASIYSDILLKKSELQSAMALRILHSLIPTLIGDIKTEPSFYDFESAEEAQKYYATDLIIGAKEILKYGSQAIVSEFNLSKNEEQKSIISNFINSGNYKDGLKLAINGFLDDNSFSSAIGGQPWSNFAKALLQLSNQIDKAESSGNVQDVMLLSSYLNAIDGMAHNTADFLEKLVQQESGYLTLDKVEELRKLRDLTRLPENDILTLMESYSRNHPEYKKLYKEYRRRHPLKETDYQTAVTSLKQMQESQKENMIKNLTEDISSGNINKIQKTKTPRPPRPKK